MIPRYALNLVQCDQTRDQLCPLRGLWLMLFQGITNVVVGAGAEVDAVTAFCPRFSVATASAIDRDDDSMASIKITKCAVGVFINAFRGFGVVYAYPF